MIQHPPALEVTSPLLLPHRVFKIKVVKSFTCNTIQDYVDNHVAGPYPFPKWEKAKRLICTFAIKQWSSKVHNKGKHLHKLNKLRAKLERDLHRMAFQAPNKGITLQRLSKYNKATTWPRPRTLPPGKEAITSKWIQMVGKPNKDFLTKPKRSRKRIGNMTIGNVKDAPDIPCMGDINIILQNFVDYYAKLYEYKKVCPLPLDRLIKNLTLNLNKEEIAILDAKITPQEVLKAIMATLGNKSPGTDKLLYKCY
jgi:hypothetical protein